MLAGGLLPVRGAPVSRVMSADGLAPGIELGLGVVAKRAANRGVQGERQHRDERRDLPPVRAMRSHANPLPTTSTLGADEREGQGRAGL